ncbi:FMN-binding glutamate synthase family protein [Iamia majanohamensis]|uniref:FMN-binding glutamate synthase family protein n=1 Tax=Iamia majanohamensis TaxID=467976 RepID=A0AAE9Y7T9_9ACTN|nr:FMN-binding glutamate synthase family protein [Iamia majanohamensis]WCO68142.1 FMN-binding glutamate synthase family protein [Iamia majanohamensis]
MIENARTKVFWGMLVLAVLVLPLALVSPWFLLLEVVLVPLVLLGVWDLAQTRHSILRNYPIVGHLRFVFEDMGPELHQYLVENDTDGRPFDRDTRSLMYERAKGVPDQKPFGTELDVYGTGYTWMTHSVAPHPMIDEPERNMRITVGGPHCAQPYSSSVLNISAMSFGALGHAAVRAMNLGAKKGGFAHDTGEGGLSKYHRENGGDLIWQVGTGYFGCRTPDGDFSPELFQETAALEQVKMIEIKVSQGAKPGHGGILPGAKVTEEIAEARLVPAGQDVLSPTYHKAFSTPREMMSFITQLRELSGGKPVGFKICIGYPIEIASIVKAMVETGVVPDFIVVDGGEGGTGAAPLEFSDALGAPLIEGLMIVQNVMVGAGLRDQVKIGASGKLVSASAMARAMALGADWCNSARGFMFAVGCIQSQRCHTNRCPVGVTTQNEKLQRALVVPDKAERVHGFHRHTVHALAEMVAAMGLDHTAELRPDHVLQRVSTTEVRSFTEIHQPFTPGQLLDGTAPARFQDIWDRASADDFRPSVGAA